ncbi:Carotene epsilon-monooxygenase, chloroplastic [Capsicum baccatum]|uniref:Carotene epsilon-monooxygenase, chloroplastic n=1 Tax=Capsicum baccatum TaxID=33114 RepID=A0A2G2WJU5_CAPBA|nr:Carotene epsilon-monooxygenase, chloroplastic [Capsicum baccatum]
MVIVIAEGVGHTRSEQDSQRYKLPQDVGLWVSHKIRDGSTEAYKYENMCDLTPDTDLLKELPEEYTFETVLADLINSSLQVVWSNHADQRRLIRTDIEDRPNQLTSLDRRIAIDINELFSMIPCGLNIKREFDISITVDISRQIKALCKIIPRQIKAENAVSVIRQTIEELISKCKEIVEFEGERINEDEYVNDRDPSILRFFLASREELLPLFEVLMQS